MLLAAVLLLSGCVATVEQPPPPSESGIYSGELAVHVDWSKLEGRRKPLPPVGGRWYDSYTGQLILRDDYGPLLPYAGLRLTDGWPATSGCLYGLMTKDGVAVTDPVYSNVISPGYYVGMKQKSHPLLALCVGEESNEERLGRSIWAIAARDGSWCTEFCYNGMRAGMNGLVLFEDDRITHMSPAGEILGIWTMADLMLTEGELYSMHLGLRWGEGSFGQWCGDYFCLGSTDETDEEVSLIHLPTGQKEIMARAAWTRMVRSSANEIQSGIEQSPFFPMSDEYIEAICLWDSFSDSEAPTLISALQRDAGSGHREYFLYDGTPLPQFATKPGIWYDTASPVGGLIEVLDLNVASYYDIKTMDCVFRTYLGYDTD